MKKNILGASLLSVIVLSLIIASCNSDDKITPEVTVIEGKADYFSESMDFSSHGGSKILNFSSNVEWTLKVSETQGAVNWCKVSQTEGSAGTYSLAVIVEENLDYNDRNVVLVFKAGDITKNVVVNQKQKDAITLTTDRFEVGTEGGIINVEVNSNVDYAFEIPEQYRDWIISESSGTRAMSSKTLSFRIAESKEYDKREGKIVFTSDKLTEMVKIYQAGSSILVLSKNEYTLGSEGGTVSIDVSSNFEYEIDLPDVGWIKIANQTRSVSSHTLVFLVSENTTYNDREVVIVFKDARSDKRESVTIRQRQYDAILLSERSVEIAQEGGTFSVDVNSNVDYAVEISSSCSNWISKIDAATTRALAKKSCRFSVACSEELEKREGEIYFKYGDITETLKVYQTGGSVLILSQDKYNLEGEATTISVQVKSNIDFIASVSDDWITEISTRAVSSTAKRFNIDTNKTGKSRTGKITFTTSDGKRSSDVIISQAPVVEATSLSINFINTSGTIGGRLYIGKNYEFTATATPSNAKTDYMWRVEDTSIASVSTSGSRVTLSTKDYGISRVVVIEKNSGISESYEFGTCVTEFQFAETSRTTKYGYPVIKMAIGDQHQLKYSCSPSYATKVFSNLRAFNFKEIIPSINAYGIVEKSTIVDIDENGMMTAKGIGTTIINANNGYGVCKSGTNDGVFIEVVKEITPYGSIGGHGYVDLGLPSGKLWATENFGALYEMEFGAYYLWTSNDRVPASWGNLWNTPTRNEFIELLNNCSYSWTSKGGVNGYQFTGKNGATMFLPAAGFKLYEEGEGYYDSKTENKKLQYWTITESDYSWEGQTFAFALCGSESSLSCNVSLNTTDNALPIRPISR